MEDAVSKGAKVTIGGKKPDLPEPYNKVSHFPQTCSKAFAGASVSLMYAAMDVPESGL